MDLYKNKYRVKSARLEGYNYARDGFYFITICTHDREMFFGNVVDRKMVLNEIGKIAANEWQKTEIIRPNVFLDEWIIMPNHLHGILIIDNNDKTTNGDVGNVMSVGNPANGNKTTNDGDALSYGDAPSVETPWQGVSTTNTTNIGGYKPEWKSGVLGAIINQFKRQCTIMIRRDVQANFAWQTRFYDHIIRNEKSLNNIRAYIKNNPQKWDRDRNNRENLWM